MNFKITLSYFIKEGTGFLTGVNEIHVNFTNDDRF